MRWLTALVAVTLAAVGWTEYRAAQFEAEVKAIKELFMQTLVSRWKDADNIEHIVTTPPNEGETAAQHAARHKESVDALKELFPPVE